MSPLLRKLNLKDQDTLFVLDAPASFEPELQALGGGVTVKRALGKGDRLGFGIAFAVTRSQLDAASAALAAAAEGDAVVWVAYPKGTSRRYRCEFNRDNGWDVLTAACFKPVRQVAIDEDWSALRLRRSGYVRSR
jgi:hypothetical protein